MVARTEKRQGPERPGETTEQSVFLDLQRVAGSLGRQLEQLLKPRHLSPPQLNLLEILRTAGPDGLSCRQIAERMISEDPDVTRILDRLEARTLVVRARESTDRRVIRTRITDKGIRLLQKLRPAVADLHARQFRHLGEEPLARLSRLLIKIETNGRTRKGSERNHRAIRPHGKDR